MAVSRSALSWLKRPNGLMVPAIPQSPKEVDELASAETGALLTAAPTASAGQGLIAVSGENPGWWTYSERDQRILTLADDPEQPWLCMDTARGLSCLECRKPLAAWQHYHCGCAHIHVAGSGRCYYRHVEKHRANGRAHAEISQLVKRLIGFRGRNFYRALMKDYCQECPYIGPDLTVDHRDGDHTNDHPSNLITLCPTCHATKTRAFRENRRRAARGLA